MVKRLICSFVKNRGLREIFHHNKNTLEEAPKINRRQLLSILKDCLPVAYIKFITCNSCQWLDHDHVGEADKIVITTQQMQGSWEAHFTNTLHWNF